MIKHINKAVFLLFLFTVTPLFSQVDTSLLEKEIENKIDEALDFFSEGDYQRSLFLLEQVLDMDPANKRASNLIKSIQELSKIEGESDLTEEPQKTFITEKPDFQINNPNDEEQTEQETLRPDFSVREKDEDVSHPREKRSKLELSLTPSLLLSWNITEDSVVFPSSGSSAGSFNTKLDYYFDAWNKIFGFTGMYTLLMMDIEEDGLSSDQLHIFDAMLNFRTYFREEIDSRIIFKLSMGYRGYFSNGYTFYTVDKDYLNGFNMGVNLEAPLLYLFFENEYMKRIIFDFDMNLLFFPELNTLNLLDFKLSSELRFKNFSTGVHFGAYSVVTTDDVQYLWMTGFSLNVYL
jgi:hypothetical protein